MFCILKTLDATKRGRGKLDPPKQAAGHGKHFWFFFLLRHIYIPGIFFGFSKLNCPFSFALRHHEQFFKGSSLILVASFASLPPHATIPCENLSKRTKKDCNINCFSSCGICRKFPPYYETRIFQPNPFRSLFFDRRKTCFGMPWRDSFVTKC